MNGEIVEIFFNNLASITSKVRTRRSVFPAPSCKSVVVLSVKAQKTMLKLYSILFINIHKNMI